MARDGLTVESFHDGRVQLYCGDALDVLAALPESSIDSVVTDPPYHLSAKTNGSAGFMGKYWDGGDVAFRAETWVACLRVLKPGGHLVAFGGSRTFDLMAGAIRAAGFEVRDSILSLYDASPHWAALIESLSPAQMDALATALGGSEPGLLAWLYGQGFPKSHDVAKAIDKRKDWPALARLGVAIKQARTSRGLSQTEAARLVGLIGPREVLGGGGFMWFETGRLPTNKEWSRIKSALALGDEYDAAFEAAEREIIAERDGVTKTFNVGARETIKSRDPITAPATPEAATWDGWGTALKPAFEPIILARRPLAEPSVARQVLATGTGAMNVGACRIETNGETITAGHADSIRNGRFAEHEGWQRPWKDDAEEHARRREAALARANDLGRWPANVVTDGSDAVTGLFPETGPATPRTPSPSPHFGSVTTFARGSETSEHSDNGGSAARFLYQAKATSGDRLGSRHPTVKPLALMQWLVRLVTPPGGTILDPFAGTGTTAEAALREGFSAILVEREAEYQADIRHRMQHVHANRKQRREEANRRRGSTVNGHGPLFDDDEASCLQMASR